MSQSPPVERSVRWKSLAAAYAPGVVFVAFLLLTWEMAPRLGLVDRDLIPPMSEVLRGVPDVISDPDFGSDAFQSFQRWFVGLLAAAIVGVPLGILMGRFRPVFTLVNPLLSVAYATPKAALVVILVLWFGVGLWSMGGVVFLGALLPITTASYHGAAGVDGNYLWAARALGTNRARVLPQVVLPAALPQILSGLRVATSLSILTLLGAEFLIRNRGIGTYLFNSMDLGLYARMWSVTAIVAAAGFVLDSLFAWTVRVSFPWIEGEV